MTMLFAAVHESGCGTNRTNGDVRCTSALGTFATCRMTLRMSASRGRPEVSGACSKERD
jgi:hypothetical protein